MADADTILTTAQAARLAGMRTASFRVAANRSPELRAAKVAIDGRTPGYPAGAVTAWAARRGGGVRVG